MKAVMELEHNTNGHHDRIDLRLYDKDRLGFSASFMSGTFFTGTVTLNRDEVLILIANLKTMADTMNGDGL